MSNFNTKEEYMNFIAAWKQAVKHENNKRHWITDDYRAKYGGKYKSTSWLRAEHYVFRNLMLGKDPRLGFSPKSTEKLQYGETPWTAYERALYRVERVIKGSNVERFLEPFEGKITEEDLKKISLADIEKARTIHKEAA